MATKITKSPDGLARCTHRNLFGNVCDECFAATANLVDVGSQVYKMPVSQIIDEMEEWILDGVKSGRVRVSPKTKMFV